MWIVRLALSRPYTFVVMAILIAILGGTAIVTMPVDIFPYIDIPIVSVLWVYTGLSPGGDGEARRHQFRAQPHFERQRHRAHRIAVLQRLRGGQDLFPSERQDRHGGGPGHRDHANRAAPDAARDVSRQHSEVRRRQRSRSCNSGFPARPCASRRSSISATTSSARRSAPCRAPPFLIRSAESSAP